MEKFIVKFDYNIENITKAIAEVDDIDLSNFEDVKEKHKLFVKIRTTIKGQEKEMVDEANKYRKEVFGKRDEYLELSVPVEEKLKDILVAEELRQIVEARKELLPEKRKKLDNLKIEQPLDQFILELDEQGWVDYYAQALSDHQVVLEEEATELKNQEVRKEREEQIAKEAEERAREDEKRKADEKIRQLEIEKEQAKQKEIAEQARIKEAEETKKKDEEALAKTKEYNKFLSENSHNEETDILQNEGSEVRLYRLVATFTK